MSARVEGINKSLDGAFSRFGVGEFLDLLNNGFDLFSDFDDINVPLNRGSPVTKNVFDVAQHIFNSVDHSLDFLGMINNDTSFLFGLEDVLDFFEDSFDLLSDFDNIKI